MSVSKEKSFKLWTSYGIWMILLPNMNWLEQIELQLANKFFYNTAVSRVSSSATLPMRYFTWDFSASKNVLY